MIDLSEGVAGFSTGRRRPGYAPSSLPPGFGSLPPVPPSEPGPSRATTTEVVQAIDPAGALTPAGSILLDEIRDAQAQLA